MSRTVRDLLVLVPRVYGDLVTASLPGRSGEPSDRSPDPREKPTPGNLSVIEHRHLLLRGLRWWVDVVDADNPRPVGDSPAMMCAVLLGHLHLLTLEDQDTLRDNLEDWLSGAYPFMGKPEPVTRTTLPIEALDAIVPVHVAAKVLGVSVRTVQRRAPDRTAGQVRLRDVAELCRHELLAGHCQDCAQ